MTLTLFVSAASAPGPLYAIYQARFGFSATVLTAIFAVYAAVVIVLALAAVTATERTLGRRSLPSGVVGHVTRGSMRLID